MNKYFTTKALILFATFCISLNPNAHAQTCEWRLTNETYNSADPDGAGPATGSVTFTLQLHSVSATIPNINAIGAGFSYQSSKLMIPTTAPACVLMIGVNNPSNIVLSPYLNAGGTGYNVNQCGPISIITGGETFDRRAVGTLDINSSVTITPTWQDLFTVTMWTLGNSFPQGGYVMINSSEGGSPGEFGSYSVSDAAANPYPANSLTFTTPLALGGTLPVLFTSFEAKCSSNGTLIKWATAQEDNSSKFEIERSTNGTTWASIGSVAAAGTSTSSRNYQQIDLIGGAAFYRIKQVDKNGQFMYTNVERTNCQVKNISSVIYPVPAFDILNVVIKSDKAVRTQLMVYDMQGKLVKKLDASVISGNNNFRINLLGLPSGDYMLRSNDSVLELNKIFTIAR